MSQWLMFALTTADKCVKSHQLSSTSHHTYKKIKTLLVKRLWLATVCTVEIESNTQTHERNDGTLIVSFTNAANSQNVAIEYIYVYVLPFLICLPCVQPGFEASGISRFDQHSNHSWSDGIRRTHQPVSSSSKRNLLSSEERYEQFTS